MPSILELGFNEVASFHSLAITSLMMKPFIFVDDELLGSSLYQRARSNSLASIRPGIGEVTTTSRPERMNIMQQLSRDHERIMKEKLDLAYKEKTSAAGREKLWREELDRNGKEKQELGSQLELYRQEFENACQEAHDISA